MKNRLLKPMMTIAAGALLAAATGCSPQKNTAASRAYQGFITRYNIYYNGDKHYTETLKDMEDKYEDDYSQLVFVHPGEARSNPKAPQPQGDFDRSIEKARKAIQLRSIKKRPAAKSGRNSDPAYKEWMRRDEYNPFMHNAWMMMGRSQFYNGDFLGAASTFFYITKHFTWLPQTVTEANIWQARAYCCIDWLFEAETILRRIKPEEIADSKDLQHLYNLTYAEFYINSHDNDRAIPYVIKAINTAKGSQKTRLRFLLGQLYAATGNNQAAYDAFADASRSPSVPYRTKFNARIKQSEVFTGADITSEVNALRRMTRYDRNKQYLDQIYYAIGNLYLSRGDTLQAIENYEKAVEKSTRSGIDKALAQLTLGGLYYDLGEYAKAQPCYSEAMPQIPDNYPNYKALHRRSDYLDELAVYSQNVELQDSLLRLSYMTPEEQRAVAERLIAELKRKEAEEAEAQRREEFMANQEANRPQMDNNQNAPTTFTMNTDNSWYFYNPSTVTAGKTEFQRRWGSRRLEDDWRRRNKAAFAFTTAPEPSDDEDDANGENEGAEGTETAENGQSEAEAQRQSDPHNVEYYLAQIPKDDGERAICNDVIQEGLYNMGVILKDKLEDFPASEREFNELLRRYPDNIYRLDTYYNLYLMYVRQGDTAKAEQMRQIIITQFPESPYGEAMRDPQYIENLRRMDAAQQVLYDRTYEAYMDNRNSEVHDLTARMRQQYPLSKLIPKFMFLDALAYVTENRPDDFKTTLTELLERYPDTDLTPYAASYLRGLQQGRKLHSGGENMRGMLWDIALTNDSTVVASDGPIEFELNPESPQLFILLYPTDQVSANLVLYEMARHNFSAFAVKDYDLEQMNFGRLGMLIIKPFANVNEVSHYRTVMAESTTLDLPEQIRPVVISADNFQKLLSGHGSFEDYFRFIEDQTYREAEESVLPPDEYGPSEGIPTAEETLIPAENDIEVEVTSEPSVVMPTEEKTAEETHDIETSEEEVPTTETTVLETPADETPVVETPVAETPAAEVEETVVETVEPETIKASEPETIEKPEPVKPTEPETVKPVEPVAEPVKTEPESVKPQPKPQTPALPEYPVGSEGDDPLLM